MLSPLEHCLGSLTRKVFVSGKRDVLVLRKAVILRQLKHACRSHLRQYIQKQPKSQLLPMDSGHLHEIVFGAESYQLDVTNIRLIL